MLQIKKTRSNFCVAMCMDCCIHFYVYNLYVFYAPVLVDEKLEDLGLHYENRMIVDKISYKIKDPERLDIIVFHVTEDKSYIKRIIGLSGDMIEY